MLTSGDFVIQESLTINGPGQKELTIDAQDASRIFRIISSDEDAFNAQIMGVSLTGGVADRGGAVEVSGTRSSNGAIVLRGLRIEENVATIWGGAIYGVTAGQLGLFIEDSTIINNRAADGGGIAHLGVPLFQLTVVDSTVTGNMAEGDGGGILQLGDSHAVVRSSVISENTAGGTGGGVAATGAGFSPQLLVEDSIVSGNSANGISMPLDSSASVTRSTISGNSGTGISAGSLTLTSSTVSGNEGRGFFGETATVVNSTISGNGSGGRGDYLTMRHSTVTGNERNGLYLLYTQGPAEISDSIIAGNTAGGGHDVDGGASVRNSLIGDGSSGHPDAPRVRDVGGSLIGTPEMPIDPMLGPLADNGGPTMTHALLRGSPAIDSGDPDAVAGMDDVPEFDQRGEAFARIADGDGDGMARIDMGAFELQAAPLAGDYNGNGRVEQADLDLVLMHWNQSVDGLSDTWTSQRPTSGIIDQAELDAVLLNWNTSRDDGMANAATAAALQREPSREARQSPSAERTGLEPDSPRERRLRPARRAAYDTDSLAHDVVHDSLGRTAGQPALRPWASSATIQSV